MHGPSAEQSAISRAPSGVSDHAMPGPWRVIIARRPDGARTWYYHEADDPRIAAALMRQAHAWVAA